MTIIEIKPISVASHSATCVCVMEGGWGGSGFGHVGMCAAALSSGCVSQQYFLRRDMHYLPRPET